MPHNTKSEPTCRQNLLELQEGLQGKFDLKMQQLAAENLKNKGAR